MVTLVNGRRTDQISIHDRGLAYGDGVFETILCCKGELPLWDIHLARLEYSLKQLNIQPFETEFLKDVLKNNLNKSKIQIAKLTVTRGISSRGYAPPGQCQPTSIISIFDYEEDHTEFRTNGVKVKLCGTYFARQVKLAGLKHLNRLEQILARMELSHSGHDEGIMLDQTGAVISATSHNIFLVKDGALITPDLTYSGIAGVMRQLVLGLANDENIPLTIRKVSMDELLSSDELFLTNSIHGIWPICELDSTIMPVGEITSDLQAKVMEVIPFYD